VSRTFRIFVSSTFRGLEAERAALHERVFPNLELLCGQRGARFQAVDLRWGISRAAMREHRTVTVCLDEVERCLSATSRPNFIALLGDRYGSVPPPPRIPHDEFAALRSHLAAADRARVESWYERDDNAYPPEWRLRGPGPDSPADPQGLPLEQAERAIQLALGEAARNARLPAKALRKYVASITEREIARGVLDVPNPRRSAFCFLREIKGLPRNAGADGFVNLDDHDRFDRAAFEQLTDLKRRLRNRLGKNVHDYEATWTGAGPTLDHLDKLCTDVEEALIGVIDQETGHSTRAPQAGGPFLEEASWHADFGARLTDCFTGRDRVLRQIGDYIANTSERPLVVVGESGVGKSALLARAAQQAGRYRPVVRFIGATPAASDEPMLLASLCHELPGSGGDTTGQAAVSTTYKGLVEEFHGRLAQATAQRPLVVFLDALDQLPEAAQARGLPWLPATVPHHASLVVSTSPGPCLEALKGRLPESSFISLERLPRDEGAELLRGWLGLVGRTLRDHQRDEVLDNFAPENGPSPSGLPLYLKLAFEEARQWHSLTPAAYTRLASGITGIIRDGLLQRLSGEADHGRKLVSHSLAYLAAARNGLSEDELLAVLFHDDEVMTEVRDRAPEEAPPVDRLPQILWSRLHYDLAPYLTERAADGAVLLHFYHRQLAEVIEQEYIGEDSAQERHRGLARYFAGQDVKWPERRPTLRKLAELPYQQARGGLPELSKTLTDFRFLERKAADFEVVEVTDVAGRPDRIHTGIFLLQEDFTLAGRRRVELRPPVVTAVDTGDGLQMRCPLCLHPAGVQAAQLGQDFRCPQKSCGGLLHLNPFVLRRRR